MEQIIVRGNIPHGCAVMSKTDISFFIYHAAQRHAPQFEEVDLLPVQLCNTMIGIGQTNERDSFIRPILFKGGRRIGADRDDLRIGANESLIIISQARQLRTAVRSEEAS